MLRKTFSIRKKEKQVLIYDDPMMIKAKVPVFHCFRLSDITPNILQ